MPPVERQLYGNSTAKNFYFLEPDPRERLVVIGICPGVPHQRQIADRQAAEGYDRNGGGRVHEATA